nr:hypothetical protein [Micromonospora viridifaciens]
MVYRDGSDIAVMLARCAHQSGPLDQGGWSRSTGSPASSAPGTAVPSN